MGGEPARLRTARLLLRPWRESDLEPLAAINADREVMEHFPSTLTRAESAAMLERLSAEIQARGYGFFAAELPGRAPLIGFIGLKPVGEGLPFSGEVEIGWRLARDLWKQGLAGEGARECVRFAFEELGLSSVLAYTTVGNLRSRGLMERLGMTRDPAEDFLHPGIDPAAAGARHVLYRLRRN